MGWWKCNRKVNLHEVSLEIRKTNGRGDTKSCERMFVFYSLLSESSEGVVIYSAQGLKDISCSTIAQCQIVWDACIKHNVLRKTGNGFSAREWMQEQGLLPDEQEQTTTSQQPAQEQPRRQYEHKEQVRPNVRLSRKEIDELKKDYSDDEITRILDKLSDYKSSSGRYYASDYQAIRNWVAKAIQEPEKKKPEIIKYPDWIFGIKEGTNDKG